ncbi:unnamed protein product, partial [Staurois parvus]
WGPRAIGDHGGPVSLTKLKKAYEKGTRGISWGPLLTPGPRAVPEFPNGQSAPGSSLCTVLYRNIPTNKQPALRDVFNQPLAESRSQASECTLEKYGQELWPYFSFK